MMSLNPYLKRIATGVTLVCLAPLTAMSQAPVLLPFDTDFEVVDGYSVGPLTVDNWWQLGSRLDASILTPGAASAQALSFSGDEALSILTNASGASVSWVDFYLKPIFLESQDLPETFESEQSAVTGFVKVNPQGEVYAVDGDGLGGGEWKQSDVLRDLDGDRSLDWIRLSYRLDYTSKKWDLFVEGALVMADLGFLDATVSELTSFSAMSDTDTETLLDYFYAGNTNPLFIDTANDGLPDDWLILQGLSVQAPQRYGDGDLDGLSNLQEYQLSILANNADSDGDGVNDGAEFFSGENPSIADAYILSLLPFTEDFESYTSGVLDSSNNWEVEGQGVLVQSTETYSGSSALEIGAGASASNFIDGSQASVVWIDLYVKPIATVEVPELKGDSTVAYYFDESGLPIVFDGSGGNGSGFWRLLDAAQSNDWRRITVKADYSAQAYDFYMDGERLGAGLGFANTQPYLSRFEVEESRLIDDLTITAVEPANLDDDRDGITNAAEALAGTNAQAFDSDGDGLSDALEVLWGLDPNVINLALAQPTEGAPSVYTWTTNFSNAEGYIAGPLDGQNHWAATGIADVTTTETVLVEDSITADTSFERLVGMGELPRVWISFKAKLVIGDLPTMENLTEPAVAIWGVNSENTVSIWDQTTAQWSEFEMAASASELNEYAVYLDYINQTWALYANGVLLEDDLSFKDEDLKVFSRFKAFQSKVEGGDVNEDRSTAEFDEITFSNVEPADMDFDGDGLSNDLERQVGSDVLLSDTDGDGMDDLWEYQNGLNLLVHDSSGDADGDGLSNIEEQIYGLNPQVSDVDGSSGFVRRDVWTGTFGDEVVSLTDHVDYPINPNMELWTADLDISMDESIGDSYGQRIYGQIVAPETGEYTFWIAGNNSCEFWLSDDSSAFNKELVVYSQTWTKYQEWAAQSNTIHLEAGQAYFFELLHKEAGGPDHVSLAWRYGSQPLSIVTGEHLQVSSLELGDIDQDGLPDVWEVANGLDASKGYGVDGYAGDLDGDGILNYQERRSGTNPNLVDSDGDGYSDDVELNELYSDPNAQDLSGAPVIVNTVDGSAFSSVRGSWNSEGTELYSVDSTGSVDYSLNFAEAGVYRIVVALTEHNAYKSGSSTFELRASLDGHSYGIRSASVYYGDTAELHYYLPYLASGNRNLSLDWLNGFGDAFLRIRSVRLERIDGVDTDLNGIDDWAETRANHFGSEADLPLAIYASPFCFEGTSFAPVSVAIESHPALDASTLRSETVEQALYNGYYTDIALTVDEDRVVLIDDQSGLRSAQYTLNWEAFNAHEHTFIHIRLNDSLLLTVMDASLPVARPIELELTAPDGTVETHVLAAEARLQALFDQAGDWELQATLLPLASEDPIVYDSAIHVSSASLTPAPILFENTPRPWTPSISDGEVVVESDKGLPLYEANPGTMPRSFDLNGSVNGGRVIARLSEDGPILSTTETKVVRDYSRTETRNQVVESFPDGTVMVSAYIILNEVPDDLILDLKVFKSGVTLDDGTLRRTVTADDFDEQGRFQFFMLRSPGVDGGNCHRYWFTQGDDIIGSS